MTEAKPLSKDQIAEAIKMATWFTTGDDTHLRSPAWNIARALLHFIATIEAREAEINKMRWLLGAAQQLIGARYDTWHRETLKTLAATEPKP